MKKGLFSKIWPILLLVSVSLIFFWKVIIKGAVLLPADLLVGAYYPWMENDWGYAVGVPYRNPLISDCYSQFFIWKKLVADAFKAGEWPLWNPYSYSGYPLLGNLHSGALYPFNLLMVLLPFNTGWNWFLIGGVIGSGLTMYWFLRTLGRGNGPSILGGLTYGFCGYSLSWMQFATAGQSMVWLPLILLVIEKYFKKMEVKLLLWLVPLFYLVISAGHFQISAYAVGVTFTYFVWKLWKTKQLSVKNKYKNIGILAVLGIWGGISAAVVLLPGLELMSRSIRNFEIGVETFNYGLTPVGQFISVIAPDFFGNPATGNYWGFLNYHETLIYAGVMIAVAWGWGLFNFRKIKWEDKYFVVLMVISVLMFLDTPVGKLIFWLKVPGLSTSQAGRISILFAFGGSVIFSRFIDSITKESWKNIAKYFFSWGMVLLTGGAIVFFIKQFYLSQHNPLLDQQIVSLDVAIRNLAVPAMLLTASFLSTILFRKRRIYYWLIGLIIIGDMFRFGWKYLPFSNKEYVFPPTEVTNFLMEDNEVFRVEKESAALLSPNTWTMYGLMSPSGYDPMAIAEYTYEFNKNLNNSYDNYSRYAEIQHYDAKALGEYNVKYLLAVKRDDEGKVPGTNLIYKINQNDWEVTAETTALAVLKNKKYLPRTFIETDKNATGTAKILSYKANEVAIEYETDDAGTLVLLDTWYPGWEAWVDGQKKEVQKVKNDFRGVDVDPEAGVVVFRYKPKPFYLGLKISLISLAIWILVFKFYKKYEK